MWKEERIKSFVRQIRNPYCFKVGNVVVKTVFADTDVTLDDRLEHYLRNRQWAADERSYAIRYS